VPIEFPIVIEVEEYYPACQAAVAWGVLSVAVAIVEDAASYDTCVDGNLDSLVLHGRLGRGGKKQPIFEGFESRGARESPPPFPKPSVHG
jgi:hypothetical protein